MQVWLKVLTGRNSCSHRCAEVEDFDSINDYIRHNEVGRLAEVETPFGERLVTYCDLTASGRFLHFVEDYMARIPAYCMIN